MTRRWNKRKKNAAKALPVSDHAVVRYLERVKGMDLDAVRREKLIGSGQTPKMAQGWLSARRWEDESLPPIPSSNKGNGSAGYVIGGKTYRLPNRDDDAGMNAICREFEIDVRGLDRYQAHVKVRSRLETLEREQSGSA